MNLKTLTEKRFFEWHEDEISVTLRNKSGSYGGGVGDIRHLLYANTIGPLCARDYKGIGNEYVSEDKLVIECFGNDCGSPNTQNL